MKCSKLVITVFMIVVIAAFGAGCGAWRTQFQVEQRQYGKAIGDGKLVVSPETETFEIEGSPEFITKILELIGRDDLPPSLKPLTVNRPPEKKKKGWFSK